jgi:hypothetical protein
MIIKRININKMRILYAWLVFVWCFMSSPFARAVNFWHTAGAQKTTKAMQSTARYLIYTADEAPLKAQLFSFSKQGAGQIMELPMPDGSMRNFRVWPSSLIPDALAARYPGLRTFTAEAEDDPKVTAKLDYTTYGFHAMIFDSKDQAFIDPVDNSGSGYYMVHYKSDEMITAGDRMSCLVNSKSSNSHIAKKMAGTTAAAISNGYQLRTYRLALACDHKYADSATGIINPTVVQVLGKMVTTMNRVNGVYERELSITMNFVANEDTLIFTTAAGDSFGAGGGSPTLCQKYCDILVGDANYDIGHVFTDGFGGLSDVGVVCQAGYKATSYTGRNNPTGDGFDIDFVAHEMGHEYGANHPFNNNTDNSCSNNAVADVAYEPGSGSTIMAYAGICKSDDLQPHSDAYFHTVSLREIQHYITTTGDGCAVKTPTNNKLLHVPLFTYSYTIPYLTPFELTAPLATDSVADTSVTYCWEQWNLGDFGKRLTDTHINGPIFRSFTPSKLPTRIFPQNNMVLAGVLSNAGTEDAEGEKVPDVGRFLTFKLTVRDIYQGNGCFLVPVDSILLDVINTGEGFTVTSQGDSGNLFVGSTPQIVKWNVAGSDILPVNTSRVDIYMSEDGGNTWTDTLGNFPNNGSATVTLPNPATTIAAARIKVKGSGNVFFNVNKYNFSITHFDSKDTAIVLYPVPAHSSITISSGNKGALQVVIYNAFGQRIWNGVVNGEKDIPVSLWARGVYIMKALDVINHRTVKKFVLD